MNKKTQIDVDNIEDKINKINFGFNDIKSSFISKKQKKKNSSNLIKQNLLLFENNTNTKNKNYKRIQSTVIGNWTNKLSVFERMQLYNMKDSDKLSSVESFDEIDSIPEKEVNNEIIQNENNLTNSVFPDCENVTHLTLLNKLEYKNKQSIDKEKEFNETHYRKLIQSSYQVYDSLSDDEDFNDIIDNQFIIMPTSLFMTLWEVGASISLLYYSHYHSIFL